MILTDDEIHLIRRNIEAQAGLNEELLRRCGDLIHWDNPKPHYLTVFYVMAEEQTQGFRFPVNQYYANVIGFDLDQLGDNLRELSFLTVGKHRDFQIDFTERNDQAFFDALFDLVARTSQELEETLSA